jgi:DNA-binding NarL/FixJ family response regulator
LLTPCEHAVLKRLVEGLKRPQIAEAQGISLRSVNRIVPRLQTKLEAPNSYALVMKATQLGLIP